MIQPAAPSILSALLPGCAAPAEAAETAELAPEFAVLLALQLTGNAGETATATDAAAAARQPTGKPPGNIGGKSLPGEVPLVLAEESVLEGIAPDSGQLPEAAAPTPPLAVLSIPRLPSPAEAPAVKQDASAKAPPMDAPIRPATQAAKPEQAPTAEPALPRLSLSAGEDAPRRARIELPRVQAAESAVLPQPIVAAAEALASPTPASPSSGIPASAPLRTQTPHDFAALVDRLVEARDTAISVRAPQAVSASITHAQFGNVTIRFETGGDALAVALSNADPEFARAVQAAAPPAQANTASDNSAQPQGQRQDSAGQQASGSSGHSQQSPSQQRAGGTGARTLPSQAPAGEPQSDRTGIFA